MATFTLTYFPLAGNGQASRFALAAVGANWKNNLVEKTQWPAVKASGAAPFGQLPFLEVHEANGETWKIAESHSLVRFICSRFHKVAASERENALADSLIERLYDMRNALSKAAPFGDPERLAKSQAWFDAEFPAFNQQLDKYLEASKGPYFFGNTFTAADVLW